MRRLQLGMLFKSRMHSINTLDILVDVRPVPMLGMCHE